MRAIPIGATSVEEVMRVVRALGAHRYVAGRLHLVHAFAIAAAEGEAGEFDEARRWAAAILADDAIDAASRDEALWRRCSDMEVAALLGAFWSPGDSARAARQSLEGLLARHALLPSSREAFDESAEDEMHPMLIDAGWELLPLAELDGARHKGAIAAFNDDLAFQSARFEEETAVPRPVSLYELPAFGAIELLRGADDSGTLVAPLDLWVDGDETYLDYVIRGVRRAAKLPERDEE